MKQRLHTGISREAKPKVFLLLDDNLQIEHIVKEFGKPVRLQREEISSVMQQLNGRHIIITDKPIRHDDIAYHGRGKNIICINHEPPQASEVWWVNPNSLCAGLEFTLKKIKELSALKAEARKISALLGKQKMIAMALTAEQSLDAVLELIAVQAMKATNSDGASIYLLRNSENGKTLCFSAALNYSRPDVPFKEKIFPLDRASIAGHVASSGRQHRTSDVYKLKKPYKFNRWFDDNYNYRTKSMITLPLKNTTGAIVGVMQVLNKKEKYHQKLKEPSHIEKRTRPYTSADAEHLRPLASLAAVRIEAIMQFDDLLKAMSSILELSDPAASGHSQRVTKYAVELGKAVNRRSATGPVFDKKQLKQVEIASLLHDLGKVGVSREVLMKKTRLPEADMNDIRRRFSLIAEHFRNSNQPLEEVKEMKKYFSELSEINSKNKGLTAAQRNFLLKLKSRAYKLPGEREEPFISAQEFDNLSAKKGNLTEKEWKMVRDHVVNTFTLLNKVQWTYDLQNVPAIAVDHHENLDGSGYPSGKSAEKLSLASRLVILADRFDALVSIDRPYKDRHSIDAAFEELWKEVKRGWLDGDLLKIFEEEKVYLAVAPGQFSSARRPE